MKTTLFLRQILVLLLCTGSSVLWSQAVNIFTYANTTASIPANFTLTNNVGTNTVDATTYLLLDAGNPSDLIITPNYDLSSYTTATINVKVATFGSGANNPLKIEISTDGGTTWTNPLNSSTPTSSTYIVGGPIVYNQVFTATTRFKFSNAGTSGRGVRIQNLTLDVSGSNCTSPLTQASAFSTSNVTVNSATVGWVRGDGNNVLVIARENASVAADPASGTVYTANSIFGSGSTTGAGNFVVYKGSGTSVDISGLLANKTYTISVYEFNDAGLCYKTPALSGSFSTLAPPSMYYRSKTSGTWSDATTWEASTDNMTWADAAAAPTYTDNDITIQNGHTVTVSSAVTADQITVMSGGILSTNASLTLNDGTGDDLTINDGGKAVLTGLPVFGTASAIRVKTGGTLTLQGSGLTGATSPVHSKTIYENNAVLEWNLATASPAMSGVTFFPNADAVTVPVLRFSTGTNGAIGGGSATVINGKVELVTGVTLTWQGTGTKTIRNGITGAGTMNQGAGGKIIFSGDTSEIGGTSTLVLGTAGFEAAGTLTVGGVLDSGTSTSILANNVVNNGTVYIRDNGNFIQTAAGLYSAGTGSTFQVDRNSQSAQDKYAFWSSPVAGQNMHSIFPGNTPQYVMTYNTATDYYDIVANPSTATPGVGYSIKTPVASPNVTFTGTPNNGSLSVALSTAGGTYNLVGNPYPSNLNLAAFYTANTANIGSTLWFWDNTSNSVTTQSGTTATNFGYATFNAASSTWTAAPNVTTNPSGTSSKTGEGFIVEALSGSAVFANDMRASTAPSTFNKTGNSNGSEGKFWLRMVSSNGRTNTQAVTYGAAASNNFDVFDSRAIGTGSDAFYSLAGAEKLVIQGRASFTVNDVVPLVNKHLESGNFVIGLVQKEGIFAGNTQAVYLHDKLTGTYTNLQNADYSFTSAAGEFGDRFEIVYKTAVLAVADANIGMLEIYSTDNEVVVSSPADKIVQVNIYDGSGRLVANTSKTANEVRIPLAGKGVYHVAVQTQKDKISKKIIK